MYFTSKPTSGGVTVRDEEADFAQDSLTAEDEILVDCSFLSAPGERPLLNNPGNCR